MKKITKLLFVLVLSGSLNTVSTQANIFTEGWNSTTALVKTAADKTCNVTKRVSRAAWNNKGRIALTIAAVCAVEIISDGKSRESLKRTFSRTFSPLIKKIENYFMEQKIEKQLKNLDILLSLRKLRKLEVAIKAIQI